MSLARGKTATSATKGLLDKDVELPKGPQDSVSALRWSPVADHLAVASWDGRVYIYDATNSTSTDTIKGVAAFTAGAPCLDCDFSKDGTMAAGAAADKKIHVMHLQSGQTLTLEGHTAPVRAVRFVDVPSANAPIIASGSWDKTVRYWDLRQPQPVATLQLPERVYAMDAAGPHLVAVAADHHLHFANLHTNPVQVWKSLKSPLSAQTRCVSLCAGGTRWAVGSIEGRVAAQVVEEKDKSLASLTFKCHREPSPTTKNQTDVYAVNAICYSPSHKDVVATAGSDSNCVIWDVHTRTRLRTLPKASGPITALSFNRDGFTLAFAAGYDWSKGYMHHKPGTEKIVLHRFAEALK